MAARRWPTDGGAGAHCPVPAPVIKRTRLVGVGMDRNEPCWCGSGKKYKKCHAKVEERIERAKALGHTVPPRALIKTPEQIVGIRQSGILNTAVLDGLTPHIRAGITTQDIDRLVHEITRELGGMPAQLGYHGFPKSVCTSLNDEVCHGIPSEDTVLRDGDILNVDASTVYNGYYSDSSRMFCIGEVPHDAAKLMRVARECVETGLAQVKPWAFLGDMGQAVHDHAAKNGYAVVREIGGHGIGLAFHEDPWVGYVSRKNTGMLLVPGMVFTIEPMLNMGTARVYTDRKNGWTVRTADGKLSAQWEITVLVTEDGHEVLAR